MLRSMIMCSSTIFLYLTQNHIVSDFDNISYSVFDFFRHFMQKCSLQRWHSNNLASDSANIVLQFLQSQGSSTASVDFELYLVLRYILNPLPQGRIGLPYRTLLCLLVFVHRTSLYTTTYH